jgi:hypothetical protein
MTATDYRHKNYRRMPFPETYDLYIMNTKLCGRVLKKTKYKRNVLNYPMGYDEI